MIYCDGFIIGKNPSTKGGWTIMINYGTPIIEYLEKENVTNNETELRAILRSCQLSPKKEIISTDSMNSIRWINRAGNGKKLKARPDLTEVAKEIYTLSKEKELKIIWESRENNFAGIYNDKFRNKLNNV